MSSVKDVDAQSFVVDVLEASRQRPVVVDFWAEWCGPCRQLSPLLETMADRFAGQVDVVKVDVDANQQLSQQFGVQGIPAVKAFVDGLVHSEFAGLQPEAAVQQFFAALGPSPADQLVAAASDAEDPAALYREALAIEVDHPGASMGLADLLLDEDDVDGARAALTTARPTPEVAQAIAALELRSHAVADIESLRVAAAAGESGAVVDLGRALAAGGQHDEAIAVLLDGVRDPASREDARAALLDVFTVLGNDHHLVKAARPRLAAALF